MPPRSNLAQKAQGRWRGLLPALGVSTEFLKDKHGPCPVCAGGGRDRFRFDDKAGTGSFFCSGHGAGDGVTLVMEVNGWDFKTAAEEIEKLIDTVEAQPVKPQSSEDDQRAALKRLWASSGPIKAGDPVAAYLEARTGITAFPKALRTVARLKYADDTPSWHPAMIALVTNADGTPAQIHRTYLTRDGRKAPVPSPRRLMPGPIQKGAAVRLATPGRSLGIAEGIETALSASVLFNMPCWAALNADLMAGWIPPDGVEQVYIFGDTDTSFTGQAASFVLAKRLVKAGLRVDVQLPPQGDWNDVLSEEICTNALA